MLLFAASLIYQQSLHQSSITLALFSMAKQVRAQYPPKKESPTLFLFYHKSLSLVALNYKSPAPTPTI